MQITCVVDNCVQLGSSLWGEHGLCFCIETENGNVLWDTGQHIDVLQRNLEALALDEKPIDALALSHAHYDHTGALLPFLKTHVGMPVYANGALFEPRFSRHDDKVRAIGLEQDRAMLENLADFCLSDSPQEIISNVRTSGVICPRPFPQGDSPNHLVKRKGRLAPDSYDDDMSLVLRTEQGIVLLCGCCHAGLRNTLSAVRSQYHQPLLAIIGGTHLAGASDSEISQLVDTLKSEGTPRLYLNHCTGERAIMALHRAFGDMVEPCPAGTILSFG